MATESARLSPRVSRCNGSSSPEQGSPRNNNEQSLHILVEPQRDGQTNMITLVSPLSGQIFSQYMAQNGACIEIQPGLVFRVPYPQEHSYAPFPPQQFQQAPFNPNAIPYGVQVPGNLFMQRGLSGPIESHSPHCQLHAQSSASNGYLQNPEEGRGDRRRENPPRKLRDKQAQGCNCYVGSYNHSPKMSAGSKYNSRREPKMNGPGSSEPMPSENGGDASDSDAVEANNDIPVLAAPTATARDARTINMSWEDCVTNNSHLTDCIFELEMSSKGGAFRAIYCGNAVEYLADGLSPATEYTFRLRVIIDGKKGRYSEVATAATPSTTPSAPNLPKVTQKTKTSLLVKWSAPYDGGSAITAYSLQWNGGKPQADFEEVYNGPERQHKLAHKLPPSTPCKFRLRACNVNGWSGYSRILECMTSACPPDAPEPPQLVKATSTTLSLQWTQPKDNGAPITEYRLEMNDETLDYGFKPVFCEDKREFTCSDLLRDTAYKFRLSASNISGTSKYSQIVSYKTLPKVPTKIDKPRLVGKAKTQGFTVCWDPPRDTGGPEIDCYIAEICDAKGGEIFEDYKDIKAEYTASGLKPGHTYKVRVYAVGVGGRSEPSPFLHVTTLPVCPCKPEPPRLSTRFKQEPTTIHMDWDSPKDDGGSPILNYILRMGWPNDEGRQHENIYEGQKRQYSVTGLKPGEKYLFKLCATNKAGTSPWSDFAELCTAPGPPDAPHDVTCTCKSATHVKLEWREPETHGTSVTGFIVEQLLDDSFVKVYEGVNNSCEIKRGLHPASYYYYRVQALSNAGPSPHSGVCTVKTLPSSPLAITYVKVLDQTSSSALLQWKHPHDNGATITQYVLEVTGGTNFSVTVPVAMQSTTDLSERASVDDDDASLDDDVGSHFSFRDDERSKASNESRSQEYMEHEVAGLLADTAYRIRVQAINKIGSSPFSHSVQLVTKELPPSPPNLDLISSSYQSIKLKWGESASPRRNNLGLNFTLQMQSGSGSFVNVFSGMAQSFSVSKLKELSPYTFRISASNDAGDGSFSDPKTFYTKAQPPSVVKDFAWKRISSTSAKLSWQANNPVRSDDETHYIVQKMRVGHSKDFSEIYNGPKTEFTATQLVPDQEYHFRICAVRFIDDALRNSAPNTPAQIKGQFNNTLRARFPVETAVDATKQRTSDETLKDEDIKKEMSDTQASGMCWDDSWAEGPSKVMG
eukprot:gene16377-7779_t